MITNHGLNNAACCQQVPATEERQSHTPSLLLRSAVQRWLRTPSADYPPIVDLAFQRQVGEFSRFDEE